MELGISLDHEHPLLSFLTAVSIVILNSKSWRKPFLHININIYHECLPMAHLLQYPEQEPGHA